MLTQNTYTPYISFGSESFYQQTTPNPAIMGGPPLHSGWERSVFADGLIVSAGTPWRDCVLRQTQGGSAAGRQALGAGTSWLRQCSAVSGRWAGALLLPVSLKVCPQAEKTKQALSGGLGSDCVTCGTEVLDGWLLQELKSFQSQPACFTFHGWWLWLYGWAM